MTDGRTGGLSEGVREGGREGKYMQNKPSQGRPILGPAKKLLNTILTLVQVEATQGAGKTTQLHS